jgi:hypothetical protein
MKYFQGPITAAWFPPLIGRQHKNIQKTKKKRFLDGKKRFLDGQKRRFRFCFFCKCSKISKMGPFV